MIRTAITLTGLALTGAAVARGESSSLTLDEQRQRLESMLRGSRGQPVSVSALKAAGIEHPGQLLYELELRGWEIDHGPRGIRLRREPRR